jgi:U3 small nucleolar RNA-associated protein 20
MPSYSTGRIVKTSKAKRGTPHQRNHRWESFAEKVAKLNSLDPLRKVRRYSLDTVDLTTTTSYFRNGLEKWRGLNICGGFTKFSQEVTPMCESLPQILHFEDKIMDLLTSYLEMKEKESAEPLLLLLADFAHDLGTRFEKHYPKAMALVISIARTAQDVDVIEWSFTCLTFMFKFLSRILVSDLRPTFDLMSPLLGKERQQPHIARFAAEAMSFLIRKAAAPAVREKALDTIIHHAKSDLVSTAGTREYGLYYHALMTMFSEAIKGSGLSIHSTGTVIIQRIFSQFEEVDFLDSYQSPWGNVIYGVLASLVHHTSSDTLKDIVAVVIEHSDVVASEFETAPTAPNYNRLVMVSRTLGVISGVRKGSRIGDWAALFKILSKILNTLTKNAECVSTYMQGDRLWQSVVLSTSIALLYAPIEAVIPTIAGCLNALVKDPLSRWFLVFCSFFTRTSTERFRSLILPYFQRFFGHTRCSLALLLTHLLRFIVAHWSDASNDDTLCILLPRMASSNALLGVHSENGRFSLPQSWQDQIVSKFERLEVSPFPEQAPPSSYDKGPKVWYDRCLPKYHALLGVLECGIVHPSTKSRIAEILLRKLKLALRPSSALAPEEAHFIVGKGFGAYSRMSKSIGEIDKSLSPLLRAAAPRYCRLPSFLEAMLAYETSLEEASSLRGKAARREGGLEWIVNTDSDGDSLVASLVKNLCTESHELRLLSLNLLDFFYRASSGSSSTVLSTMILIEQTPLDLQTVRSASMHIRKLASMYQHHTSDLTLRKAIPFFCFGMLTVKFSQIWDDASTALAQIAESTYGEDTIAELAFQWLEAPSTAVNSPSGTVETEHNNSGLTDFECSNLIKLDSLSEETESEIRNSQTLMLERFEVEQKLVALQPCNARAQALRVLSGIPRLAEKRSRLLIPMFLSWSSREENVSLDNPDKNCAPTSNWSRKDQKAQLSLFGLFINPRVLYKSDNVRSALLALLANGDLEIQKSALKALFTWKTPEIRPYEENLLNLLDEARFKDEIMILLQGQTLIQPEHREELMPVLLRLLYGRAISGKGATGGKRGMGTRRLTVLRNLTVESIGGFLDIALGELKHVKLFLIVQPQDTIFETEIASVRKQVGFVNMMEDVIKELGKEVSQFTTELLSAILYCLVFVSRQLQRLVEDDETAISQVSMLKVVRQTGLKCLILLFANNPDFDWYPFMPIILQELVSPKLDKLPIETAQGVSGLLQLLSTWSKSSKTVLFLGQDQRVLPKVAECLAQKKSKEEVKIFALGIINHIVSIAKDCTGLENLKTQIKYLLDVNMDAFLTRIGNVLQTHQDVSKGLLNACLETVSQLAPFVSRSTQARNIVDISTFLLDQPTRRVDPKAKSDLLLILEHFVPLYNLQEDSSLKDRVYNTVASLFEFFRDRTSREVLSRVLQVYAHTDPGISQVASLCTNLNSFVDGKLDEPDYDRRLVALRALTRGSGTSFTAHQWRPILYNMLYYIKHDEEFGILSSNSSDAICTFIDDASRGSGVKEPDKFQAMLSSIVLPALYSGAREESEFVRREYLKVIAHVVKVFPDWSAVNDMQNLLGGDDELEKSFFSNVLATGKGKQSSALGQLAAAAGRAELSCRNVANLFIPLLEHFIFNRAEGSDGHNLAAEATTTIGVLVGSLEWLQLRPLLRKYIGYISSKMGLEKQIIKLLAKVVDALALASDKQANVAYESDGKPQLRSMDMDPKHEEKCFDVLAATLPERGKLAKDLTSNIVPPLISYLHDKDESTVSLRVPVAVVIVRLLKLLPEEQLAERLPPVLTDICYILRSQAQESRDMARETLTKICILLGPSCFGFVLKELRGALVRGYQLHVLSYTMHSILVATTPGYSPGDLNYCLPSIVATIIDDIFGATGQEKDAKEYVSKMKEVKSSKSHDSMELVARTTTLNHLTDLINPIRMLLKEKLDLRTVRKIDELLNRIASGLLKNPAVQSRDSLVFCYEVIQDAYNSAKQDVKVEDEYRLNRYLIQKDVNKNGSRGSTTVYTYKLVRFAFDILRLVLKKYDNLRTAPNLAGFIPILGDALVQTEEEIKVSTFRLLTTIVMVPLKVNKDGTDLYKIAAAEAIKSISSSPTTASDISQAGLKLMSVILRDRKDIKIKDSSIDELIERLKDDLTNSERRHVTFNFLRAVLDSRFESASVYDTMDYVGNVMVTNDDKDTRDLARGAYFQFLREYPQTKNRWSRQLAFIVANLKYEREGGRLSILEVVHLLLCKSSNDFVQEVSATCFVPLLFVLINDDSEKCRLAAVEVIKAIFRKGDKERTKTFLGLLRSWITQSENPSVLRLAFLTYKLFYEDDSVQDDSDLKILLPSILTAVTNTDQAEPDWELTYASLQLTATLCDRFPSQILAGDQAELWMAVRTCLSYPHIWVKLSAARLLSSYFTEFTRANVNNGLENLPLRGSYGLKLNAEDILDLIRRMSGILRTPGLTELLATEVVRNLSFLGQCVSANSLKWTTRHWAETRGSESEDSDHRDNEHSTALEFIFRRLSFLLRREASPPRAAALIPKTAALQLMQILCSKLPAEKLSESLQTILAPLHNLTDPSIPTPYSTDNLFKESHEALKSKSQELMALLQHKCGTTEYTSELLKVRETVKARRDQRSSKRKVEAVTAPEKFGRDKKKKVERKKERRKERSLEHRDQRRGW